MRGIRKNLWLMITLLFLAACTPLIGPYSPTAYQNATSLKVETLALMDKATEPYEQHKADVDRLYIELDKAYEYDKGLQANKTSADQWKIVTQGENSIVHRFFMDWAKNKTLPDLYITEKKKNVGQGFDEIICLEVSKGDGRQCKTGGVK